jgi:hypothetical protein
MNAERTEPQAPGFKYREVKADANLLTMIPEKLQTRFGFAGGKVEFEVPRFRSTVGRWFGRLLRSSPTIQITLDEVGTFIWNEIDGSRNVEEIGQKLQLAFGEKVAPLYPRLAGFLRSMEKNGFIRYRKTGRHRSR